MNLEVKKGVMLTLLVKDKDTGRVSDMDLIPIETDKSLKEIADTLGIKIMADFIEKNPQLEDIMLLSEPYYWKDLKPLWQEFYKDEDFNNCENPLYKMLDTLDKKEENPYIVVQIATTEIFKI